LRVPKYFHVFLTRGLAFFAHTVYYPANGDVILVIQERDESFLNFLTPSVVIILGVVLLTIGAVALVFINFIVPILSPDDIIQNAQMNLSGQIIGTTVVLLFLLTVFRVKNVETKPISPWNVAKVVGVACLALTVAIFLAFILFVIFTILGIPIEHSYGNIILGPEQLTNPWNIVLFFATASFGAAIFEELIFRRMLIPTLEIRGMAPTAAVITSSLGFAMIHFPNDILYGSLGYVITHFITTFTLGIFLGFVYVTTRNVIYPMIIHGFINFIGFTESILLSLDNITLLLLYSGILLILWIIGIIVGAIALFYYLREPKPTWVKTIQKKSGINILPGLAGFLIIGFMLILLPLAIDLLVALLFFPILPLIYFGLLLAYILLLAFILWLANNTEYEVSSPDKESPPPKLYDKANEVKLEPPQE
jgi:membrane protease YdiL (CAAX protease family)